MALEFGSETYRAGALERIGDACLLMEQGRLAGSIYLAGRAVEGMLRALIFWKKTRHLETGHDLKKLAEKIGLLGLLQSRNRDDSFMISVQEIAPLWHNDFRFAGEIQIERWWLKLKTVDRKNRTLKRVGRAFIENCVKVVERSNRLWQR